MAWLFILLAGLFEITWPFVLKKYEAVPFISVIASALFSVPIFYFLGLAMKSLPPGTVYVAFIGLGSIGVTLIGILFFHENTNALRLASLALAILGVIGLKYFGAATT